MPEIGSPCNAIRIGRWKARARDRFVRTSAKKNRRKIVFKINTDLIHFGEWNIQVKETPRSSFCGCCGRKFPSRTFSKRHTHSHKTTWNHTTVYMPFECFRICRKKYGKKMPHSLTPMEKEFPGRKKNFPTCAYLVTNIKTKH